MISDPDLVRYACIAQNSTVLAEFNSLDSSLQSLAHQCLNQAPPHHSMFSHTIRNRTYTFLIDKAFVFFGIFDERLEKEDQLWFLNRLKEALYQLINHNGNANLTCHCFQGELHPVFHRLLSKGHEPEENGLPENRVRVSISPMKEGKGRRVLTVPLLGSKIGLKKKRLSGEDKVDLLDGDDNGVTKSKDLQMNGGFCLGDGGRQRAKKIWRRHVWIVLILDLSVCLILFGIWLFICRGFQCIDG